MKISSFFVIIPMLVLSLFGCAKKTMEDNNENKYNYLISDFNNYETIIKSSSSIDVVFEDEYSGSFNITDQMVIGELENYIVNANYTKEDVVSPGTNRYLTFKYEDDSITVSSRYIKFNDIYYLSSNASEIDTYLQEYAINNNLLTDR